MGAENKFTAGPWELYPTAKDAYGWDVRSGEIWLATVLNNHSDDDGSHNPSFPTDETGGANARLIAAAPDLLAALEIASNLLENVNGAGSKVNEFRALIAKARNE